MKCSKCGLNDRSETRTVCVSCHRQQVYDARKSRKAAHPEQFANEVFNNKLWSQFRLRRTEYDKMLAEQDGVCAICQGGPGKRGLHVDHDHKCCSGIKSCGKCVRGLLCNNCNTALGGFRDSVLLLGLAAQYLTKHS